MLELPNIFCSQGRDKPSLPRWNGLCLHGHWGFNEIATLSPLALSIVWQTFYLLLVLGGSLSEITRLVLYKIIYINPLYYPSWLFEKSNLDLCKIPKLILKRRYYKTFSDFCKSTFLWFFYIPSYYGFWKYQKWFKIQDKPKYHFWFFKTTLVFRVW